MNSHHADVMASLGNVLSTVNITGDVDDSGGQGQQSGYGGPAIAVGSNQPAPWGAVAPAPARLSFNYYGNGNNSSVIDQPSNIAAKSSSNEHDSLQNILYDSGIYDRESTNCPTTPVLKPECRERKASIDIFLSQSPSRALGEDAFRVMNRTSSATNLQQSHMQPLYETGAILNNRNGGLKPLANTAPSSRSESPSPQSTRTNTVVNTQVGSPYNCNHNVRQTYLSQFSNNPPFSPVGNQQQHGLLHPQLQQPSLIPQYAPHQVQQQVQQSQYIPMPIVSQQQQPQVFYMAVQGPDGKQVLQPVQMVQMPGQAGTIMMPVAANGGMHQDVGSQAQMMLMQQPLQQANNGGMGNNMFGQGNQVGNDGVSNGSYSQCGNEQSSSAGYDNRFSKKIVSINGLGDSGQYPNEHGVEQQQIPNGSLSILYSSSERPSLRALLGNVRRLSRDQVGCRVLQQALDEDGPSAATAILNEGLIFWAEAMVDPFGNYLFQKILERITPAERVTLVGSVSTRLVNASLNLHGTRSVQKIVEVCAVDEEGEESQDNVEGDDDMKKDTKRKETAAKILTDALKPSAARLCIDSHGNHAIQRILLKLPYQYTQFIFDAVAASVEDVARHRHGCCVIQRCLDSRHSAARTHLVTRIVEKSLELMQDAYGNYVVQYVLDVCGDDEVHSVCESVIGKVCLLAVQKFSSNVMEKCLERCVDRVREEYLNELNDSDRLRELMMDPFGNYVVQRALSVSTHAQAIRLVETMKPHLSSTNGGGIRNTAGGRRILGKICRRFPNFVFEGETFEDYDLNKVLTRDSSPHHQHGGGRRQNQFDMHPPPPGASPNNQRRNGGGRPRSQLNIPQYHQNVQHQHAGFPNVIQPDANVMPAYQYDAGANPYLFLNSM